MLSVTANLLFIYIHPSESKEQSKIRVFSSRVVRIPLSPAYKLETRIYEMALRRERTSRKWRPATELVMKFNSDFNSEKCCKAVHIVSSNKLFYPGFCVLFATSKIDSYRSFTV